MSLKCASCGDPATCYVEIRRVPLDLLERLAMYTPPVEGPALCDTCGKLNMVITVGAPPNRPSCPKCAAYMAWGTNDEPKCPSCESIRQ